MKLKLLSALSGLILIGFGFSLQPVHSDNKLLTPNKLLIKNQSAGHTASKIRGSLHSFVNASEKVFAKFGK